MKKISLFCFFNILLYASVTAQAWVNPKNFDFSTTVAFGVPLYKIKNYNYAERDIEMAWARPRPGVQLRIGMDYIGNQSVVGFFVSGGLVIEKAAFSNYSTPVHAGFIYSPTAERWEYNIVGQTEGPYHISNSLLNIRFGLLLKLKRHNFIRAGFNSSHVYRRETLRDYTVYRYQEYDMSTESFVDLDPPSISTWQRVENDNSESDLPIYLSYQRMLTGKLLVGIEGDISLGRNLVKRNRLYLNFTYRFGKANKYETWDKPY